MGNLRNRPVWAVIPIHRPDRGLLADLIGNIHADRIVAVNNDRTNMRFPTKVLEIVPSSNTGYARGANLGIRKALKNGAEWIAVLNQDLRLAPSVWPTLSRHLKILHPCVAGPFAGQIDPVRWSTVINESDTGRPAKDVGYLSGSFIVFHRTVFDTCGLFHEPFFMYYEDADLSVRAKRAGFTLQHLPLIGVRHVNQPTAAGERLKRYYLARNHLLFVRRQAPFAVRLRETVRFPKSMFEHLRRGESMAARGITDFYIGKFGPFGGSL